MWGPTPDCGEQLGAGACVDPSTGAKACCTRQCHVLGHGQPEWSLLDPSNPSTGGIVLTHAGVPPARTDPWTCPKDPITGAPRLRTLKYILKCDSSLQGPVIESVGQNASQPCEFVYVIRTAESCGCIPNCIGRNCGSDQCGGFCNEMLGYCPLGYLCEANGVCCKKDCRSRQCGDDGCGGSCGTCTSPDTCVDFQCKSSNPQTTATSTPTATPSASATPSSSPSNHHMPAPSLAPKDCHTNVGVEAATYAGLFLGGAASVVLGGLGVWVFRRRQGTFKMYKREGEWLMRDGTAHRHAAQAGYIPPSHSEPRPAPIDEAGSPATPPLTESLVEDDDRISAADYSGSGGESGRHWHEAMGGMSVSLGTALGSTDYRSVGQPSLDRGGMDR